MGPTKDMTLYLLALLPPFMGGRRGVTVLSEVVASCSPRVLGGVVLSEALSPRVVEDLLARRESLELELELFLDFLETENLRRCERTEGIAKVGLTAHGLCSASDCYEFGTCSGSGIQIRPLRVLDGKRGLLLQ